MNGEEGQAQRVPSRTNESDSLIASLPDDLIARLSRDDDEDAPRAAKPAAAPASAAVPAPQREPVPPNGAPAPAAAPVAQPRREAPTPAGATRSTESTADPKQQGPRIDLQATITEDDLVTFNHVWGRISGEQARVVWGARIWSVVPVVGGVVVIFMGDFLLGIPLIVLGLVLAIAAGPYYKAAVRRAVRRQLAGKNPAMLGPRRIVLDQTGVFEGGRYDRLQVGWPGVVDLVLGKDAFYVFYGTMQAVIVPKRAFRSAGDFERTIHTVERLYGRRATSATTGR